ncbi:MAG: DUF4388 domain-containing protein [Acidimicrobiia bacterium]
MGLHGTLDTFSLAEILGLIERARHTGALLVESPEGHGTLYTAAGRFCAGEAADYSGPVEDRHALDVRLIDVCFHLMRFESGSFEFTPNEAPPWTAERATDIAPIVETVEHIVRAWPAVEAVLPSFDVRPQLADDLPEESLTLSRNAFKVFTLIDGERTVRQIAREVGHSVVEVGPLLKDLIEHGAVGIDVGDRPPRAPVSDLILPAGAVHVSREAEPDDGGESIEMVTSVPDPSAQLDGEALDRERALLAARAGLDPGPVPTPEGDFEELAGAGEAESGDTGTSEITSDRGALLRLFSGLRDQG